MKKKLTAVILAGMLAVTLSACAGAGTGGDSKPGQSSAELLDSVLGQTSDPEPAQTQKEETQTSAGSAETDTETAGNSSSGSTAGIQSDPNVEVYDNEDGTYFIEGRIGDTFETDWFTFTINDAYQIGSLEGYTQSAGNVFVVVDMTITNTDRVSVDIYNSDFQLQWGDDADDTYSYAIGVEDELLPGMFGGTTSVGVGETVNGLFVFEAPAGNRDFSVSFQEYYSNEELGDLFFVYFTAKPDASAELSQEEESYDIPALGITVVTQASEWEGFYEGTMRAVGFGADYEGIDEEFDASAILVLPDGGDSYFEIYSDGFDIWTGADFGWYSEEGIPLVSMYVEVSDDAVTPVVKGTDDAYVADMYLDAEGVKPFAMTSDGVHDANLTTEFTYVDPDRDGTMGMTFTFNVTKVPFN